MSATLRSLVCGLAAICLGNAASGQDVVTQATLPTKPVSLDGVIDDSTCIVDATLSSYTLLPAKYEQWNQIEVQACCFDSSCLHRDQNDSRGKASPKVAQQLQVDLQLVAIDMAKLRKLGVDLQSAECNTDCQSCPEKCCEQAECSEQAECPFAKVCSASDCGQSSCCARSDATAVALVEALKKKDLAKVVQHPKLIVTVGRKASLSCISAGACITDGEGCKGCKENQTSQTPDYLVSILPTEAGRRGAKISAEITLRPQSDDDPVLLSKLAGATKSQESDRKQGFKFDVTYGTPTAIMLSSAEKQCSGKQCTECCEQATADVAYVAIATVSPVNTTQQASKIGDGKNDVSVRAANRIESAPTPGTVIRR